MICEKGSSPENAWQAPSCVRYRSDTVNTPLKISLLPTSFVSVTEEVTRLVRISAAPSRPGERSSSSEKVKSFSAMWVSSVTCCPSCRFSTCSSGAGSASEQTDRDTRR